MKHSLTKLAFIFLFGILCNQLIAADYYFSTESGDDSRTAAQAQNPETPWKSIDKLNAMFHTLKPGDAIYFKRGEVFFGTIHMNKSGAMGRPIKLSAYGSGSNPVITSMQTLNQWKPIGGGKFESQTELKTSEVALLIINGQQQELGRYPNSDTSNEGYLVIDGASRHSVRGDKLSGNPNWKGGEVVIKMNQWVIDHEKITGHSGSTINFNNKGVYDPKKGYGFFIQSHIGTLDKFGEWYFDPSRKKASVYFGNQNASALVVQVPTLDHLLTKTYGASHLYIEHLQFSGSNRNAVDIAGGRNLTFSNVKIEYAGENAVQSLSVVDLVIEKSHIKSSNNSGLFLRYGNESAIVRENIIENTGLFPGSLQNGDGNGVGIYAVTNNTRIENNRVLNTGYSGIHFGGNNTVVQNNFVENFCIVKADGGGIYTYGGPQNPTFHNRKVVNNIILNAKGSWGGIPLTGANAKPLADGIFLDDNANGVEIIGNTVGHAANSGIKMSNVTRVVVKDNTLFNASQLINLGNNNLGGDVRNVVIENNIFFSKYGDQYSYRIQTHKNDIKEMGRFESNYFFRPFGDEYSINYKYNAGNVAVERTSNLKSWKSIYQKDQKSTSNKLDLKAFKINKKLGGNRIENGGFDSNTKGFVFNNADNAWLSNKIDGGSLQVDTKGSSSVVVNVGNVKKDKKYLLQFKSLGKRDGAIRAYLRHSGAPWEAVSPTTTFEIGVDVLEFSTILSPYSDVDNTVLMLATDDPGLTYWIDNLELVEVDAEIMDPKEKILFEYNATHSPKTITLSGAYVDAKNKKYEGKVTLAPFSSIVLLSTSQEVKEEIEEEPKPEIKLIIVSDPSKLEEGGTMKIKADLKVGKGKVKKVNYYSGVKLLGTYTQSPYEATLKDLPSGEHNLWASAVSEEGKEITSGEIEISVKPAPAKGVDKHPSVEAPVTADALYFNTGGSREASYKGKTFVNIPADQLVGSGTNVSTNTATGGDDLFHKSRFAGSFGYTIPVPNGTYTVETYHIEPYYGYMGRGEKAGQRVFDIHLEGELVKKDVDLYVENGNKATVLTFRDVVVTDGVLDLKLEASANSALISGIAILPQVEEKVVVEAPVTADALYFNTGGSREASYKGKTFVNIPADQLVGSGTNVSTNTATGGDDLFHKSRFAGSFGYAIPVPNGTYTVETYHIEPYYGYMGRGEKAGQRVFDIHLEGELVKKDVDLYVENGNKATVLTFRDVVVTDGVLDLKLEASANSALISGIAIKPQNVSGGESLRVAQTSAVDQVIAFKEQVDVTQSSAKLYPNPAKGQTTLEMSGEIMDILIHNINGQLMGHYDPQILRGEGGKYIIPLSNFAQGIYIVSVSNGKTVVQKSRLIVTQ